MRCIKFTDGYASTRHYEFHDRLTRGLFIAHSTGTSTGMRSRRADPSNINYFTSFSSQSYPRPEELLQQVRNTLSPRYSRQVQSKGWVLNHFHTSRANVLFHHTIRDHASSTTEMGRNYPEAARCRKGTKYGIRYGHLE